MNSNHKPNPGRTPLFHILRKASQALDRLKQGYVEDVSKNRAESDFSRREFLKSVGVIGIGLGANQLMSACSPLVSNTRGGLGDKKIVIVGAGMAGLNCALQLEKAGYSTTLYEASKRSGGRMYSAQNLMGEGLSTEIGGEFIDSTHEDILNLVKEFNLTLLDTSEDNLPGAFFFRGAIRSEAEAVNALIPILAKIKQDLSNLSEDVNYLKHGGALAFDNLSIEAYLNKIGASGWIKDLIEVAYVTEYGLEISEQSALNLLLLIGTEPKEDLRLFGDSDERYKIKGGNELLVKVMAEKIKSPINLEHHLEAIRRNGSGYDLHFRVSGSRTIVVKADLLVLTLPFSVLRDVEISSLNFSPVKIKAINELSYGKNAKLFASYSKKVWRDLGYNGNVQSDEAYQLMWDNSQLQGKEYGGLTFYSGGQAGISVGEGTAESQVRKLLAGVEKTFPTSGKYLTGKFERFHWPSHAFTKGSYAVYRPGQWTSIRGAEIIPEDGVFFAGEHCSLDFQGFMNGAAESGREAAQGILAKILSFIR